MIGVSPGEVLRFAMVGLSALSLAACDGECEDVRQQAERLLESAAACHAGESCVVFTPVPVQSCLEPFQCATAVNAATDLEQLGQRLRALQARYEGCQPCAESNCLAAFEFQGAQCNVGTARCELRMMPRQGGLQP